MGIKFLFIFFFLMSSNKVVEIGLIRKLYAESVMKKEKAEQLIGILTPMQGTPLMTGYLGAANMVMAKHVLNPIKKISYFRTGREYLENSIKKSPDDTELRFLRHAIQVSAPSFLGYDADKVADRRLLMNRLRSGSIKDKQLQRSVVQFLLLQDNTAEEKLMLNRIYKNH
jgi:hypothetical protein